jgi:type II secretory pathway component PulF
MALYSYQAYGKDGKKIRGTIDAPSQESVLQQLSKQGMYPISVQLAKDQAGAQAWYKVIFQKGITLKDKILFTKQLAVLLKSGIPLLQALELLIEQFEGRLKSIIIAIKDGIKEGKSLADGLSKYPKVFDTIYVQLVRAGEASGKLEVILDRLVEYMERRAELTKKVKGALSYPMIQLGIVVIVVIGLLTFVIPTLTQTFAAQGTQLPATTRFLMATSDFIRSYYIYIIIFIIVFIIIYRYWSKTPQGARTIDKIKLRLPVINYFTRMGAVVQFSRTLGMLLESGVNLSESLDIVVKIIDNRILKDALSKARDNIIKQGKIAEYLRQTNIFPPIAIYLLKTGEESGQLDYMLLTVAKNYETDLAEFSDSLASKLEPIMLIVMAVVVGFIVLSVVQPMMQMTNLG